MDKPRLTEDAINKEREKYVGKRGQIAVGKLTFEVIVLDYKESYGRRRFLVRPVAGSGDQWAEKVSF